MADKDITIGIKTTGDPKGAQVVTKSISQLEQELKDARLALRNLTSEGDEFQRLAAKVSAAEAELEELNNTTRQLGTSGAYNKGGASAGTAILEASRAFEDLQYGVRGVLNNIPSLIFALGGSAGLAGVISVAAVGASALWTRFSGGAKDAKKDADAVFETLKQLVDIYTELDKDSAEDREKAAKRVADNLKGSLSDISTRVSVETDEGSLQAAKERAAAQLQLAQDRLKLAELEQRISFSSGSDSLRLAKEREETIRRIYDTELAISEVARKQALLAAEAKTRGAAGALGTQTVDAQKAAADLTALEARALALTEQSLAAYRERIDKIKAIDAEIDRVSKLQGFSAASGISQQEIIDGLQAKRGALETPAAKDAEIDAIAQRDALAPQIAELTSRADAANTAQENAARAMEEAARALVNLRETQGVERRSEAGLKATDAIAAVGRDVTQAAKDAIAAIQQNASDQGRAPNVGEQEAIGRVQKLLSDTTPDAQQGSQLAGLLRSLDNNLTAKDLILSNNVIQIINSAKNLATKYQGLADKVADLENRINQIKSR